MDQTCEDEALLERIIAGFAAIREIRAIAFSGSSATKYVDEFSDYDFYVYSDQEIDCRARREIVEKYASRYNIDNRFYETDDEWLLRGSNKQVEFIYRSRSWMEESIERVWQNCAASVGYSTCFVYNIRNCRICHDPDSWLGRLQAKTQTPYPEALRRNIIAKNVPMLYGRLNGSFCEQIRNAVARRDDISVNHRISVFLASYFDVLFAVNRVLCPGEKKLLQYAQDTCPTLPEGFAEELDALLHCPNHEKAARLETLVRELKRILPV